MQQAPCNLLYISVVTICVYTHTYRKDLYLSYTPHVHSVDRTDLEAIFFIHLGPVKPVNFMTCSLNQ